MSATSTRTRSARRASQRGRPQLLLVPGDEYLASIEPESLQVLTYCKLSRVSVEVQTSCLPWKSPSCTFIETHTKSYSLNAGRYPVMVMPAKKKIVSESTSAIITTVKEMVSSAGC